MTASTLTVTDGAGLAHCPIEREGSLPSRFTQVYEAHFVDLYRFLRRLGVHPRDVEDVCHEVFLVFHRRISDVLPGVTDRAFLFGIGARVAADYRRLKRHEHVSLDAPEASATGSERPLSTNPEAIYVMRRELACALDRLSEDRRAVLVMHELEGLSAPEMAAILEVPLNTVYSRLRLARIDFERAVSGTGGADG